MTRAGLISRRLGLILAALCLTLCGGPAMAQTGQRLALVVGVGDYGGRADLPNARRDARDVEGALRTAGFSVTLLNDPSSGRLRGAVNALYDAALAAPADTTILVYFAGHAVRTGQDNYLLPAGGDLFAANLTEADLEDGAIKTRWILNKLSDTGKARLILVFDACQTNPFSDGQRAFANSGLAPMTGVAGGPDTVIVFSAEPEQAAAEGPRNGNSPFTARLVQAIAEPGKSVSDVFLQTREQVSADTAGRQRPMISGSMSWRFREAPQPSDEVAAAAGQFARASRNPAAGGSGSGVIDPVVMARPGDGRELLRSTLLSRSIDDLRRAADAGDGDAQYLLAIAHWDGVEGLPRDPQRVQSLLRRSVARGVVRAANALGTFYCCSGLVEADGPQALEWYTIAREQGSLTAQTNIAGLYRDGSGVPADIDQSMVYYRMAADGGDPQALTYWADIYAFEKYGRLDRARALELYQAAFNAGDPLAALSISRAYSNGQTGVPGAGKDPARAVEVLIAGAEAGCVICWREAAGLYTRTDLGMVDLAMAFALYSSGAEAGDGPSMLEVGKSLSTGRGVTRDLGAGFAMYERAAAYGVVEARGSVGLALARRAGTGPDPARAAALLRQTLAYDLSEAPAQRHQVYSPNYWGFARELDGLITRGEVPALRPTEVAELRQRYGQPEGRLVRFTVPIDCGADRVTMDVYVLDWDRPNDETPVDDQAAWLQQERGCTIPADVLESFHKLKVIARENNVSFVELSVYALGTAQQTPAPPAATDRSAATPASGS